ncbi:MAG: amino acid permease [Candidatus Acidiferrales bacterium]
MASQLLARKPLNAILAEASEAGEHSLRRSLGPVNLVTLGIGAIIGTGIFVLTGPVAATAAGPAIVLSFIIAGIGCAFAGLCYAEFAALLPIAGSSYSYACATLGEIVAWVIGWALVLEYAFGAATVAVGWGGYVCSFLQDLGIPFPAALSYAPGTVLAQYQGRWEPVMSLPHAAVPIMSSLPHVLDLARSGAAVLFLIDELFAGTNSADRRVAAEAVIRALLDNQAIGLVTSHDLALSEIGEMHELKGANVHFSDLATTDGPLKFDYRIHRGRLEQGNALKIIRLVGLVPK